MLQAALLPPGACTGLRTLRFDPKAADPKVLGRFRDLGCLGARCPGALGSACAGFQMLRAPKFL